MLEIILARPVSRDIYNLVLGPQDIFGTSNTVNILSKSDQLIDPNTISDIKDESASSINIRYEWASLPSSISIGDQLVFSYADENVSAADFGDCIIQKYSPNNSYYCLVSWSSKPTFYEKKENYLILLKSKGDLKAASKRDEKRMQDLQKLASALQAYYKENHQYPCGNPNPNCVDYSIPFQKSFLFPVFRGISYADPINSGGYEYAYYSDNKSFFAYAGLENSFIDNKPNYYCVDSSGLKKIVTKRPKPIIEPLSCKNLWDD